MAEITPEICPCSCECDFLEKLDKNIYDIESEGTFLKIFFDVVCSEFCDLRYERDKVKNDFYLSKQNTDEAVVKGQPNTIDCLSCKTVVVIDLVGDTPGASDYIEGVDFIIDECGINWIQPQQYYPYYSSNYYGSVEGELPKPYYPLGRKEPDTGITYYVTYKCGVRNDKLYDNFGILVDLVKKNSQTFPDYREAIRTLIIAYLLGPTIEGLTTALSILVDSDDLYIEEAFRVGWFLNESFLYTEADYANSILYTGNGTIFKSSGEGEFEFDIYVYNSEQVADQELFEEIVEKIKPAHTIAFVHFV